MPTPNCRSETGVTADGPSAATHSRVPGARRSLKVAMHSSPTLRGSLRLHNLGATSPRSTHLISAPSAPVRQDLQIPKPLPFDSINWQNVVSLANSLANALVNVTIVWPPGVT